MDRHWSSTRILSIELYNALASAMLSQYVAGASEVVFGTPGGLKVVAVATVYLDAEDAVTEGERTDFHCHGVASQSPLISGP